MALSRNLITWCEEKNYKIEKLKIYGKKETVYFSIVPAGNFTLLYFNMISPVKDIAIKIKEALKENKKLGKRTVLIKDNNYNGIVLRANIGINGIKPEDLEFIIETTIKTVKELGGEASLKCSNCGKDTNKNMMFGNNIQSICTECEEEIREQNENHKDSAFSYIRGILGAAIGALIGGIPWLIVYLMGWVVGILAFLIGIVSFFGYKLFKGPKNRTSANVIVYLFSIASVFFWWFAIVFLAYLGLIYAGYDYTLSEVAGSDIRSLVISIVIAILGLIGVNQKIATYTIPKNPTEIDI